MANDERDELEAVSTPLAVEPNDASRAIMRALADKLGVVLRLQVGLADRSVTDMVSALLAGRFDDFLRGHERFRQSYEEARKALATHTTSDKAMSDLDPAYAAAYHVVENKLIEASTRAQVRSTTDLELMGRYISHGLTCTDPTCGEIVALTAELKRRRIDVPEFLRGGRGSGRLA